MAATAVASPPLDADVKILVDWLELTVFISGKNRARLDDLDDAFSIQAEEAEIDDAAEDTAKEERRALIEAEIDERCNRLEYSYPFTLSADGEELRFKDRDVRRGGSFYLFCLVLSHATRSEILDRPPGTKLLARARRREFQIVSTLAVAGHLDGPALSVGWPRTNGTTALQTVARACALSLTGTARVAPAPNISQHAKDSAMDVIGWRPAPGGAPPPAEVCFGQAASGHGWREKNAPDEIRDFYRGYYEFEPDCQATGVTIIPFQIDQKDYALHGRRHGSILDRLRTPKAAVDGLNLAINNGVHVDEVEVAGAVAVWLGRYRAELSQAA